MKKYLCSTFAVSFFCVIVQTATAFGATGMPVQKNYPRIKETVTETRFTKAIEDLPLMPGLEIIEDGDVLFVFGAERIAQTTAKGKVDIDAVYYFYEETLPQLGWSEITPKRYEREGETLNLNVSSANKDGLAYVHFEVVPE